VARPDVARPDVARPDIAHPAVKPSRTLAAAPALAIALACLYQALTIFANNHAFAPLETEVGFWGRDSYQPTAATLQHTDHSLVSLVTRAPAHPDYLALRANQLAWESYWATDQVSKEKYAHSAVQIQYNALQNRPANRQDWVKLERYAAGMDAGSMDTGSMDNSANLVALTRVRRQLLQPPAL
jgi:hypothetical protein